MRALNFFSSVVFCGILIGSSVAASAATFAPTPTEVETLRQRVPDAALTDTTLPAAQIDEAGIRYYAIGDMRYSANAVETDSAFSGRTWPAGVLYYQFDAAVTAAQRQQWRDAAATWTAAAPVSFVESAGAGNYVRVKTSTTLNDSYVGLQGGPQDMHIANWSYKFIIAHEIGHALGLIHEQCRRDRDTYVTILWDNVESGEEYNFEIDGSSVPYGTYDFDSVMHYSRNDFSSNGSNTIQPTTSYLSYLYTMGQTSHLSGLDASGMAERYGGSSQPVPNDNFASRQTLTGSSGTANANSVGATKEVGEPDHAGFSGGASIWYSFTAGASGSLTIDTRGSNYDTLLHVWQGAIVSNLSSVAGNDDIGGGVLQSSVTFTAIVGQTYQIAVDGFDGASGAVRLNWQGPAGLIRRNGKADFDGDGDGDFVWQNTQTGEHVVWFLRNGQYESGLSFETIAPEWRIGGAADLNADGHADLVWQNTRTGEHAVWFLRNGRYQSGFAFDTISPEWEIASVSDFNSDAHADLVWQNTRTGEHVIWFLRNGRFQSALSFDTISPEWRIAGAADFNSDGETDFVWQNLFTGERVIWLLRSGRYQSSLGMPTIAPQWRIAAVADFNGDGEADLAWQNIITGERVMWFLRSGTYQSAASLPTIDRSWEIANH